MCAWGLAAIFFDLVSLLAVDIPKLLGVTCHFFLISCTCGGPAPPSRSAGAKGLCLVGFLWCQKETVSSAAVKGQCLRRGATFLPESGERHGCSVLDLRARARHAPATGCSHSLLANSRCSSDLLPYWGTRASAVGSRVPKPQGGGEPGTKTSGRRGAGHTSLTKLPCICHLPYFLHPLSTSANIRKVQGPRLE